MRETRKVRGSPFQARSSDDRAQAELRRWSRQPGQEERLGLLGGQAGEASPVPVHEADAARGTALGVDRDAGLGERLDVPVDRPDRDLQLACQLS
jgi:hypothetical protein